MGLMISAILKSISVLINQLWIFQEVMGLVMTSLFTIYLLLSFPLLNSHIQAYRSLMYGHQ